jgi:peptidoglycan/LPS O-acetylase OafA/YrhL
MSKGRIFELDGLRTLAISAVLLLHFTPHSRWFTMGWVGVDLFFVISGFLITGILLELRSDPTPYRKFYWRRILRIFPPYYAVLAIIAVLVFVHREGFDSSSWLQPLFFLPAIRKGISLHLVFQRLLGRAPFDLSSQPFHPADFSLYSLGIGVYWSLAVEELFYLLWAPIVLKTSKKWIGVFAIAPLFLCPALRGLTHTVDWREGVGFIPRFDTLAVGACIALLLKARPAISKWAFLAPILPLSVATIWLSARCGLFRGTEVRSTELFSIFGYSLIALLFGCIVASCVRLEGHSTLSFLRVRPILYIGTISYTMYLVHFETYVGLSHFLGSNLLLGVAATGLTVAIAALSWKYFESPILRYKPYLPFRYASTSPISVPFKTRL